MSLSTFQQLLMVIRQKYPNYAQLWERSRQDFGVRWEEEISSNIDRVFGSVFNTRWEEAVDGYAEFCTEALRAQLFFEKTGRYKATSYADVFRDCYQSSDYMDRRYLPGQYLSHFIWPHHQKMLLHFSEKLLPQIAADVTLFYEIGVGCGMYSQKTLQIIKNVQGVGYDISDYALQFTFRIVRAHGLEGRYEVRNQDIITRPIDKKCDLIISQEVLEHLEDPQAFIKGLFQAVRIGGWAYITAAINAAHTDHIYLYRSAEEVRNQIEEAGWVVKDIQVESNYAERPVEKRPTVAGFLAQRSS